MTRSCCVYIIKLLYVGRGMLMIKLLHEECVILLPGEFCLFWSNFGDHECMLLPMFCVSVLCFQLHYYYFILCCLDWNLCSLFFSNTMWLLHILFPTVLSSNVQNLSCITWQNLSALLCHVVKVLQTPVHFSK